MNILLVQLPIPKLNYGLKTGNIPLGAACLKQAAAKLPQFNIEILPESISSYIADSALINLIISKKPDMLGFTVFSWNVERSLYIAEQIKNKLNIQIIFGGPEITKDNALIKSDFVDYYVYGEGEQAFINLLINENLQNKKHLSCCSESIFKQSKSPYIDNLLEPGIENLMLLETQRGCPYKCGFCFYNKSRKSLAYKDINLVIEGVRWAVEKGIDELYILDPSLNVRPHLKEILKEIALINNSQQVSINSEIRAEWIDEELADLFLNAGFTGFEIGLQSTNKKALQIMRRPTDFSRFLKGANLLKEREILPRIDLIVGLPGDDLDGFSRSIGFVAENDLYDDVQVFPLSILPGTEFRQNSKELQIKYETTPPYTIIETPGFSQEDMLLSFDYAESLFDVTLFPFPHLDVAWKNVNLSKTKLNDVKILHGKETLISKIILDSYRPLGEIEKLADQLTFPYQVFVNSDVMDYEYISNILNILTIKNPFSPFELIFLTPYKFPDTDFILNESKIKRPHFLDNDLRYLFAKEGNRAILFTVISDKNRYYFSGEMKRQIFLWTNMNMPNAVELEELSGFDGIVIDNNAQVSVIKEWQNKFATSVCEMIPVSFADLSLQKNWLKLTAEDDFFQFDAIKQLY